MDASLSEATLATVCARLAQLAPSKRPEIELFARVRNKILIHFIFDDYKEAGGLKVLLCSLEGKSSQTGASSLLSLLKTAWASEMCGKLF